MGLDGKALADARDSAKAGLKLAKVWEGGDTTIVELEAA